MMKTTIIKNIGCGLLLLGTTACADYLDKEYFDTVSYTHLTTGKVQTYFYHEPI